MGKQQFREDAIAVIRHYPIEGPPETSATIELWTPGAAALQASAGATLGGQRTIDATGGLPVGSSQITLDAGSGDPLVGEPWWLGVAGSDALEQVLVRDWTSGTLLVEFTEPTQYAHADGEAFADAKLTYALTTTHTADLDENYRAEWGYTVGGVGYVATTVFDIVARVFKLTLKPSDLLDDLPTALRHSVRSSLGAQGLISRAQDKIERDLRRGHVKPQWIRDPDQFTELGVLAVQRLLYGRNLLDPNYRAAYDVADAEYNLEFGRIMASRLSWIDRNEDLATGGSSGSDTVSGEEEDRFAPTYIPLG